MAKENRAMQHKKGGRKMDIILRNMASVFIVRQEKVLMMYRVGSRAVPPSWVGVGGHFEPEELNDPKACVLRELREEIGLSPEDFALLRLRYIVLHRLKSEVRQNHYFFAKPGKGVHIPLCSEEGSLSWQELTQLEGLTMPRTVKGMLCHYYSTGQHTRELYVGISGSEGVQFSLLEDVGRIL